jgi:hypothetical protein
MGRLSLEWQSRLGPLLVASDALGPATRVRLIEMHFGALH